jgi:hypothetical protein
MGFSRFLFLKKSRFARTILPATATPASGLGIKKDRINAPNSRALQFNEFPLCCEPGVGWVQSLKGILLQGNRYLRERYDEVLFPTWLDIEFLQIFRIIRHQMAVQTRTTVAGIVAFGSIIASGSQATIHFDGIWLGARPAAS